MSFLDGFLGGAAQTGLGIIDAEEKKQQQMELLKLQKQLDIDKAETIEKMKLKYLPQELQAKSDAEANAAEAARLKKVGLVNAQLEKNADADNASKFADPVMGDTPLTPEQQAVLDEGMKRNYEERKKNKENFMKSSDNRLRAEVETGHEKASALTNNDAKIAGLENRFNIAQLQAEVRSARDDASRKEAQARLDLGYARLEAAQAKAGSGNLSEGERKTYTSLMQSVGRDIQTATASLKNIYDEKEKAAVIANIEDMKAEKKTYMDLLANSQSGKRDANDSKTSPAKHQVGDTQTVQAGVNKGKTVRWDGTGWVLQ